MNAEIGKNVDGAEDDIMGRHGADRRTATGRKMMDICRE